MLQRVAVLLICLLAAGFVHAKKAPIYPLKGEVPVAIFDPADGAAVRSVDYTFYYTQTFGYGLGGFAAAGDAERAEAAAELVAPLFQGFDLPGQVMTALQERLDHRLLADGVTFRREKLPVREFRRQKPQPAPQIYILPELQSGQDFSRVFVRLSVGYFDPERNGLFDPFWNVAVTYEVRFPGVVPTDKRLENARQIGAMKREHVVPLIEAAIPELVDMLAYELQRRGEKNEKLGALRKQPAGMGGKVGMRVVRERGERLWLRSRAGGSWELYCVPREPLHLKVRTLPGR